MHRAVTIGTFDGIHLGHQRVLKRLLLTAKREGLTPMVAFFPYSPSHFFRGKQAAVKLLTTPRERMEFIRTHFGIRRFQVLPVNRLFFSMTASDFLSRVARRHWGAKVLVMGGNFGLGLGRAFNNSSAHEMAGRENIKVEVVPLLKRTAPVSSTRIRGALAEGDLPAVRRLLGRPYEIRGKVIRGSGIGGSRLRIPTANLDVPKEKLLPLGVFRARVKELNRWAALNIGFRPTVSSRKPPRHPVVEAHVPGFHGNLYGRRLTLELHERLRPEKNFGSVEELQSQIKRDIARIEEHGK